MGDLPSICQRDFVVTVREDGSTLHLEMRGDASGEALEPLDSLLTQIHDTATQRGTREAVIDMTRLEFMSSSCFKCLVTWVTQIQSLDEDKQYRLRFVSNPTIGWQKRSLRSLHCFAVDLITIDQ